MTHQGGLLYIYSFSVLDYMLSDSQVVLDMHLVVSLSFTSAVLGIVRGLIVVTLSVSALVCRALMFICASSQFLPLIWSCICAIIVIVNFDD